MLIRFYYSSIKFIWLFRFNNLAEVACDSYTMRYWENPIYHQGRLFCRHSYHLLLLDIPKSLIHTDKDNLELEMVIVKFHFGQFFFFLLKNKTLDDFNISIWTWKIKASVKASIEVFVFPQQRIQLSINKE